MVTVLATVLRTKLVAVVLGPAGVGLMGVFGSLMTVVSTVSGAGTTTSGVRHVAEAARSGDEVRVARAVYAVRHLRWRLGVLAAVLLAALSIPISQLTFGSTQHALSIAVLSLAIAATAASEAQVTMLQGLRRMRDLAKVAVLGTTISALVAVPVLVWWRAQAVEALLLTASGAALFAAWWYARRVVVPRVHVTWADVAPDVRGLLRLGLASMAAAVMVVAVAYAVRVLLVRELGFGAAGIYQSAVAVSGVYCGFILAAMGADFLPRVSAVANDDAHANRLVNEQAEVGLLLAFPGSCASLAFAPLLIHVLYSPQFALASEVLRWQVLGMFLRVASWPLGYLLLAKRRAALYFWTELSYNLLHATLIWLFLQRWGLIGAGVAFFGLYIYYSLLMSVVTHRLTGFVWSNGVVQLIAVAAPTIAFVFACPFFIPSPWDLVFAGLATAWAAGYSIRGLMVVTGRRSLADALLGVRALLRGGSAVTEH